MRLGPSILSCYFNRRNHKEREPVALMPSAKLQRIAGFGGSLLSVVLYCQEIIFDRACLICGRSWAGDSGPGMRQDIWIEFDPHVCLRLEIARTQGEQRIDLDPENPGVRHIDLSDPANIKQVYVAP